MMRKDIDNPLKKLKPDNLLLGLAGDVMIGRIVDEQLASSPPAYIWGNALPYLVQTDVNLVNLEAALTVSNRIVPKVFNFKSHPSHVKSLQEAKVTAVNLANNHVLDYDEAGLLETLKTLDQSGIRHVGAGKNSAEAVSPVILDIRNVKIGILGCTDNEPGWNAGSHDPGTFYVKAGDLEQLQEPVANLRKQADIVILSMHWGPNMRERPPANFVNFARALIDMGVDIIHGHSAHIFQGVENYKGRLILYDTGDFVDDYAVDPFLRNDRSFLFLVELDKKGIRSLRLVPTLIDNCQVNIAEGKDAVESIARMQKLSKEMGTDLEARTSNGLQWCLKNF